MKFVFLILHYKNVEETKKCIDSIYENIDYEEYDIVVVDNGSNNGTFEELKKKYKKSNLYLMKSDINLGFAKGNNLGFSFAKKNLKPDFIVMINSDTIIFQKDFCLRILEEYKAEKFDVLGPDILDITKTVHTNPNRVTIKNKREIKKMIKKMKLHIYLCKTKLEIIYLLVNKILNNLKKEFKHYEKKQYENIELHGSCLIFSKEYIERFDGLNEETFLYFEESFLYYRCKINNLKNIYSPNVKIIHNESQSTKFLYKNVIKRRLFYYENSLNSCEALLNLVEKDNIWK